MTVPRRSLRFQVEAHIRQSGAAPTEWLSNVVLDLPQDDIVAAAARFLGADALCKLAERADKDGDALSCAKLALLAGKTMSTLGQAESALELFIKAEEKLTHLAGTQTTTELRMLLDRLEIACLGSIFRANTAGPLYEKFAGRADYLGAYGFILMPRNLIIEPHV